MELVNRYLRYVWREVKTKRKLSRLHIPRWIVQAKGSTPAPWYAHFSPGMERIPHLDVFVGKACLRLPLWLGTECLWPRLGRGCSAVLTWGRKDKKERAARFATLCKLPVLRLEDGFLRSLDLGVNGAAPLSLVADSTGIYYDATTPSDLENLLNSTGWESPDLLAEARCAMEAIKTLGLSKYNHATDALPGMLPDRGCPRVLLLDQTAGDLSVSLGLADASTFTNMLDCALRENPAADIYIKSHPDVLAGKKRGFLTHAISGSGVTVLSQDVNPLSLLRQADIIYTVSSQMGFEALMLGKTVHCFGMPFYAGWGLTHDRQSCSRRVRRRTLEEVFAAAYLKYARYVHPSTRQRCSIHAIIQLLNEQKQRNEANAAYHACVGFNKWKHPHAKAFLHSTRGRTEFFMSTDAAVQAAVQNQGRVVVWSSRETQDLTKACQSAQVPLHRMEDGFLRSVGLGSDYLRPGSLVLDDTGIHYDSACESRLERLLRESDFDTALLQKAATLRQLVVAEGITKYNVGDRTDLPTVPAGKTVVLVPGQVEDDASVLRGGCGIYSSMALLREVRTARPNAFVIYKEHPDVVSGSRPGGLDTKGLLALADCVVRHASMHHLLPLCHEVHTLTSLTGFEALLRGIPVWTYGAPFYAGWNLTTDRVRFVRRRALPSVDYLVAGALLRYASYYDWNSRCFVDCETFVHTLGRAVNQAASPR